MRVSVFIATSLDGFIATADDGLEWLDSIEHEGDHGYGDFMASVDVLLMGRRTFEVVNGMDVDWPYTVPVVVASTSGLAIPDELTDRATVSTLAPGAMLDRLGELGYSHVYLDGGQLISSFLREGLVDQMIITTIPILLGTGIPLFSGLTDQIPLTLEASESWSNGLIQDRYVLPTA